MSSSARPIIVGVGGPADGTQALDWAVEEAQRWDAPLQLLYARSLPLRGPTVEAGFAIHTTESDDLIAAAVARAHDLDPRVDVTTSSAEGSPAAVLVDQSRDARCLVVGARGRGPLGSALLGSTSIDVAAHASCPVVVVRELPQSLPDRPGVVVGSDGSELSEAAISVGFTQADRRGLPLTVVHAWAPEYVGAGIAYLAEDAPQVAEEEEALAAEVLAGWAEKYPDVTVRRVFIRAHPVAALVDASKGAELVVVGSRGRGGFAGLLLGSVSQGVLHHAHCPVMVVRPERGA